MILKTHQWLIESMRPWMRYWEVWIQHGSSLSNGYTRTTIMAMNSRISWLNDTCSISSIFYRVLLFCACCWATITAQQSRFWRKWVSDRAENVIEADWVAQLPSCKGLQWDRIKPRYSRLNRNAWWAILILHKTNASEKEGRRKNDKRGYNEKNPIQPDVRVSKYNETTDHDGNQWWWCD
jgi:hypothetical protein